MSNIYIQEPPTNGKVLLETTAGDIDIELWSREAPKACRNFIQLCMESYYDGVIFHRLVKGFIVQGGDPTGTGTGGNSIWGKPFKDEFHSRLRFNRRGLVAMANAGKDDNGSQFFFTLGQTTELQNKHTLFGKIAGDTIYNLCKFEDAEVDDDEKPLYPHKIIRTKILSNPFDDIVVREVIKREKSSKKSKAAVVGTKNYKLLSFGTEAEEEEEEVSEVNKKFIGKGKSSHDLTSDPKLSSELAVDVLTTGGNDDNAEDEHEKELERTLDSVKEKLKRKPVSTKSKPKLLDKVSNEADEDLDHDDGEYYLGKDEEIEKKLRIDKIQSEFKKLKREMKKSELEKARTLAGNVESETVSDPKLAKLAGENNLVQDFVNQQKKYKEQNVNTRKKGADREAQTLALLKKFQSKITEAKESLSHGDTLVSAQKDDEGDTESDADISWLARKLENKTEDPVLAKDASLKTDDWFEIYDPRNPLNKRRRGENKDKTHKKSSGDSWKKSKMID